jgi:hypothetical protein
MGERCLLLQFADAQAVVAAAHQAHEAGCRQWDVFAPYALPELHPALAAPIRWINLAGWGGALLGALLAIGLQVGAAYGYPVNIGGRPALAVPMWPVLMLLLSILFGAFGLMLGFAWQCRLPRLHHPLFDHPAFSRVSDDGFFLCIAMADPALGDHLCADLSRHALHADEVQG